MDFSKRLHHVIPGGAHTYSRGDDQYPSNAPQILERGEGSYSFDPSGNRYLDYGMALRAVNIGYAEPVINAAAWVEIEKGNNLTRASTVELRAAELLVSLIDSVDMVKFTKNGSTATSAAVKLSRAYTGRKLVARCAQQPFFSYDDWFIGSTVMSRGVPEETISMTKLFNYNDIESLRRIIEEFPDQIACVMLEPAAMECPAIGKDISGCCGRATCTRAFSTPQENFLKQVQELCNKNGIVFILDEMITGFRWHLKGAQHVYGVNPDLTTFGKAMANGFSVGAVCGKREIMKLGSIDTPGAERLFLLSTTHGAEMSSLGAFIRTMQFLQEEPVIKHLWSYGEKLCDLMRSIAKKHGLEKQFVVSGPAVNPYYLTLDSSGKVSFELRTLFLQEMVKKNVLMAALTFCYRHDKKQLSETEEALEHTFTVMRKALDDGVDKYVKGAIVKPVFRKYN